MSSKSVEFFYDLSSPWTYLAFNNIQALVKRAGASMTYRPILVGGVFNAVNQGMYAARENTDSPKMKHYGKSLKDWAAWSGLSLQFPSQYHPAKSVAAMRMACVLEDQQDKLYTFTKAAFESYFLRAENLDDPKVLVAAANALGLDGEAIAQASTNDANKLRLRNNTEELIRRGGYGSPTIFINRDDMYFGNDQLPLIERALSLK